MSAVAANPPARGRFEGVLQIVRYNWPQYLCGALPVVAAMACLILLAGDYAWLRIPILAAGLVASWWCVASLIASHWIYDRSELCGWSWIPAALPKAPSRWLNLHAGLDECSDALRRLIPDSVGRTCDFFAPAQMSEPSIRRARARQRPALPAERVDYSQLPFGEKTFDAVFVFFAAHELRCATSREALFRELLRVLMPRGTILLVEHTRDLANLTVFGPGFLHSQSNTEWRRLAKFAGLEIEKVRRMTPFVRIVVLRRTS